MWDVIGVGQPGVTYCMQDGQPEAHCSTLLTCVLPVFYIGHVSIKDVLNNILQGFAAETLNPGSVIEVVLPTLSFSNCVKQTDRSMFHIFHKTFVSSVHCIIKNSDKLVVGHSCSLHPGASLLCWKKNLKLAYLRLQIYCSMMTCHHFSKCHVVIQTSGWKQIILLILCGYSPTRTQHNPLHTLDLMALWHSYGWYRLWRCNLTSLPFAFINNTQIYTLSTQGIVGQNYLNYGSVYPKLKGHIKGSTFPQHLKDGSYHDCHWDPPSLLHSVKNLPA